MSSLFNIAAGGETEFYPFKIDNSLRFDDGSSTYLQKLLTETDKPIRFPFGLKEELWMPHNITYTNGTVLTHTEVLLLSIAEIHLLLKWGFFQISFNY